MVQVTGSCAGSRREADDETRVRDRYERDVSLQHDTFAAYERLADTGWAGRWVKASDAATIMQAVENLR